jgi:fluoride exporter
MVLNKSMGLFFLVCLGGTVGTAARYLLGVSIQAAFGPTFPVGTLSVNLIGSFFISMLMYLGVDKGLISTNLRIVLCTGVMGGFTTYSSFNFETMRLWQQGSFLLGFLNIGVTLVGCLITGALGLLAGRLIGGA